MSIGATGSRNRDDLYFQLVRNFPLRPIRSEKELDRAIKIVDALIGRDDLCPAEEDYLEVLSDLVERYETEHHPILAVSDAVMLRHLMEARGVSQSEVALATGIVNSTISEVLREKRKLSRSHIGKLAHYFHVDPGALRSNHETEYS